MIKVFIAVGIGILIGSLIKPVAEFVTKQFFKLKTWWKNR